ncbi:MAG: hypothetical protein ACWA6X_12400 [Bauldia sp.]
MFSRLAIAAALVAGAAAPALAFAGWHGPFIGPLGGFLFLLAVVAVVLLVVSLFGASRRRTAFAAPATVAAAPASGPAFAILAERFARGDIDAREYEARRRVLAGETAAGAPAPDAAAAPPPPAAPGADDGPARS